MPVLIRLALAILALPAFANEAWVSGYYVGYQSSTYPPEKVDLDYLTHIMVGRVIPKQDGSLETHLDLDPKLGPMLAKELAQRARAKRKKAILFVGGAGEQAGWRGATSPTHINKFVDELIKLMEAWSYHGLDLDWEPITKQDEPALLALVRKLRQKRPDVILSLPVGWINPNTETVSSIYKLLNTYIDQFNIMSYGMAGAWTLWRSWHSSALFSDDISAPSSVESSVSAYTKAGLPREKLGIGIGFYGSCWQGRVTSPKQITLGSKIVASDNEMSYRNIVNEYYSTKFYFFDKVGGAPYLSSAQGIGPRRCTFLSYEDETSVKLKADFIKQQGLGGAIVWTINQGYLPQKSESNPLLRILYQSTR